MSSFPIFRPHSRYAKYTWGGVMHWPDELRRTLWCCQAVVWLAGWLAPTAKRRRWRDARDRQLWHWVHFLAESGRLDPAHKLELARFCRGLFADAFWQRYDRERFLLAMQRRRAAPGTLLLVLSLLLGGVVVFGGFISAARAELSSAIARPDRVCVVKLNGKFRRFRSETLFDLAASWTKSKLLDGLAVYSWGPGRLAAGHRDVPVLSARVAAEYFPLLGVQAALGRTLRTGDAEACRDCVVLSDALWRQQFHADAQISGRRIKVDGAEKIVIGVLPGDFRLVAPDIGIWSLLDTRSPGFTNFVERIGAVGRMKPQASPANVEADLADLSENAGYIFPASLLAVSSARQEHRRIIQTYSLFFLLAVTCAVWIVYMRRPEGCLTGAPTRLADSFRWWSFFVLKSLLLLLLTCLLGWTAIIWGSILLVGTVHPLASAVALWFFLIASTAPLSWAIHDQQKRCRVCLRRLGIAIRIAPPGYVLLNWSGTEMMCPQGHGVLYLPDSEANSLERDRWSRLDASWSDLFSS